MFNLSMFSIFLLILLELNAFQHSACIKKNANDDYFIEKDSMNQSKLENWREMFKNEDKINETNQQVNVISDSCSQIRCRIICYFSNDKDIENDIKEASGYNETACEYFTKLQLHYFKCTNNTLPVGFLGQYINKFESIYIINSNVTHIQAGAFGGGIFQKIYLKNLKIDGLHMSFFENITSHFEELSIIQEENELKYVSPDFLYNVRYQIKSLTINAGITCVRNLTASENLLNNLIYVDFKYNKFGNQLQHDTFLQLSVLEHLDLSYSEIEFLPDYIFRKMYYLIYLDLSHNKIVTISKLVFNTGELFQKLYIYANDNPWSCDCHLQAEMKNIFAYHLTNAMYCAAPPEYKNWSVFDDRLCTLEAETSPIPEGLNTETTVEVIYTSDIYPTTTTTTTSRITYTTSALSPTSSMPLTPSSKWPSTTTTTLVTTTSASDGGNGSPSFECVARNNSANREFSTSINGNYAVKITLKNNESTEPSNRVFWFCKKAKDFYKDQLLMTTNNTLGCYNPVSNNTIVPDLFPDMSYTFCLIGNDQEKISPFGCKSVHVGGNIMVLHHTWSSRKVRATRISLFVFGIVLSLFSGILAVFLLLKHKPMLLKGNKRIMTPQCSTGEIVVLPKHKTVDEMNHKEEMLAKNHNKRFIPYINRRDSIVSIASTVSYMNTNIYEYIPTYLQLEDVQNAQSGDYFEIQMAASLITPPSPPPPPLPPTSVHYTKIPQHRKRTSSDPLPELPGSTIGMFLTPTLPRVSDASAIYATLDGQL